MLCQCGIADRQYTADLERDRVTCVIVQAKNEESWQQEQAVNSMEETE